MKKFKEKLIARLEEVSIPIYDQDAKTENKVVFTDVAKNSVNQLAEEYNNGWIPCSERLPEEKEQERMVFDPITFAEIDVERYMASDLVNVTVRHYDSDDLFVSDDCTVDGKWVNYDGEEYEVTAWQPLPEPYQPKGE